MEINVITLVLIILATIYAKAVVAAIAPRAVAVALLVKQTTFQVVSFFRMVIVAVIYTFASVLLRVIKFPVTVLVYVVKKFVPNPDLKTLDSVARPSEVRRGNLIFEEGKFYMQVDMGDYDLKIKMNGSSLFALSKQGEGAVEDRETMVQGSRQMEVGKFPTGQVALTAGDGRLIGLGVRCVMDGREGLLTAAHVLTDLKKQADPRITTLRKNPQGKIVTHTFKSDWTLSMFSRKMDLAMVDVPADVFSSLGVGMAKLGRLPGSNSPINVTRYGPTGFTMAGGKIVKTGVFFEHSASTLHGTSGAPIFWNNKVVGIHLSGMTSSNKGVALDTVIGRKESDVRDSALTYSDYVVDGVEYDLYVDGKSLKVEASKNVFTFSEMRAFEKKTKEAGKLLWHEIDFDSDDDDESGNVEIEPEVLTAMVKEETLATPAVKAKRRKAKSKTKAVRESGVAAETTSVVSSEQDFQTARVRGSPPTSVSTLGNTQALKEKSKAKTPSASPVSAARELGLALANSTQTVVTVSSIPKSRASKGTSGQRKTPLQSQQALTCMPEVSHSVSNPAKKQSTPLCPISVEATQASKSTQERIVASLASSLSNSRLARKRRAQRAAAASAKIVAEGSLKN